MKQIVSYGADIIGMSRKTLEPTVRVFRDAVSFLIDVVDAEWDAVSLVSGSRYRKTHVEHLVHTGGGNTAKYPEFDKKFHKFPSYLRRSAIAEAVGTVSSYRSNLANWEADGKKGNLPRLQRDTHLMPVFYNDNMFRDKGESYTVHLKLYLNNDWVWVPVRLKKTDMDYINKYWGDKKRSCPTLEKHFGRYSLRFAFEENIQLMETDLSDRKVCAVDLGLNTDAVCTIMASDGTVPARKFIDFPSEKDQLWRVVNRIKKIQSKDYKSKNIRRSWAYARRLNDELAKKIASAITTFAYENGVHTIVFEYLDFRGKRKGGKKQKLALWKKNAIQEYITCRAHRFGIHISRICAWGTSRLAFDGSGRAKRGRKAGFPTNALCRFQNGKTYNCDLNASYNIGARYFVREHLKTCSETERSHVGAKVPDAGRRTQNTLSTLVRLSAELQLLRRQEPQGSSVA